MCNHSGAACDLLDWSLRPHGWQVVSLEGAGMLLLSLDFSRDGMQQSTSCIVVAGLCNLILHRLAHTGSHSRRPEAGMLNAYRMEKIIVQEGLNFKLHFCSNEVNS